jgi:cation diffusion facilitator family transporter
MTPSSTRYHEIRRVLIITLIANILVAAAKLIVGLMTGTLAMVADAFHSTLDASSNVIGLASSAIAARPPDEDHPYGHRRFETLASMAIGGMLLLTAWEITRNSIESLMHGSNPEVGFINFAAMILTILINIGVTFYEGREARRLNSEFLQADAEHTRSDVLVSISVLGSLVAVWLGFHWVDAVAALIVVAIIVYAGWHILQRSAGILVDHAALDPVKVRGIAEAVAGVVSISRIRSRGPADDIHLDLDVQVSAATTTGQADSIVREMRARLRSEISGLSDIQVHFLPMRDAPPDYAQIARAEADALGLGVHEVIATTIDGSLALEMHIEVEPEQSIGQAHRLVSEFEERLLKATPDLQKVVTHIEPAHTGEDHPSNSNLAHQLAHDAAMIARRLFPDNNWHDVGIRAEADGGYALSMHCYVPAETPLEEAHRLAEVTETRIRAELPALHRVTIHTEPPDSR